MLDALVDAASEADIVRVPDGPNGRKLLFYKSDRVVRAGIVDDDDLACAA